MGIFLTLSQKIQRVILGLLYIRFQLLVVGFEGLVVAVKKKVLALKDCY